MYGWSVCWGGGQPTQLCELFPGCVVIVKEGDLGFPLKKNPPSRTFILESAGNWRGGVGGREGGERQDAPTASTSKAESGEVVWKGERMRHEEVRDGKTTRPHS